MRGAETKLREALDRDPADAELAHELQINPRRVKQYHQASRAPVSLVRGVAPYFSTKYGYDSINRLSNVVSAAGTFVSEYWSVVSDRVVVLGLGGQNYYSSEFNQINNTYDDLLRLSSTTLVGVGGATRNQHGYSMNEANQRTQQTFFDGKPKQQSLCRLCVTIISVN